MNKIYSIPDAAEYLGITHEGVKGLMRTGKLPTDQHVGRGNAVWFTKKQLDKVTGGRHDLLMRRIQAGLGRPARLPRNAVAAALEALCPSRGAPGPSIRRGEEFLGTQPVRGTEREKLAKRLRYRGLKHAQIAEKLGVTPARVYQLLKSHGFNSLLAWYEGEEWRGKFQDSGLPSSESRV